jgi:hypothetical protein
VPKPIRFLKMVKLKIILIIKPTFKYLFQDQSTYVTASTDPQMTLVAIFDSHIMNIVSDLTLQLCCNKMFANVKPITK